MMPSAGPRSQCACGANRERRAASPCAPHLDVVRRALPHRHARVREVRNRQQALVAALLDRLELDAHLLDPLRALPARLLDRRVSSPWRLARATSSPAVFCSRFSPSSSGSSRRRRFKRRELLEFGAQIDAAILQRRRGRSRGCREEGRDRACGFILYQST